MTLSGPYGLSQGGLGLVARKPIYLDNEGRNILFGVSVAVLNVPEIFNRAELKNLSNRGYAYQIYKITPEDEIQIISANTEDDMSGSIEGSISVPN